MTREERDELYERMQAVTVEPSEPMTLEQLQYFVKGYEQSHTNILDAIDATYRENKTD